MFVPLIIDFRVAAPTKYSKYLSANSRAIRLLMKRVRHKEIRRCYSNVVLPDGTNPPENFWSPWASLDLF